MTSFPFLQVVESIGPYGDPLNPAITFAAPLAYGDVIVIAIAAVWASVADAVPPSSVSDNLGNTYALYSQTDGLTGNVNHAAFLYAAINCKGGTCTITVNGAEPTDSSNNPNGPTLIAVEYEVPSLYQSFATASVDYDALADGGTLVFRALANNGAVGGGSCSDTTLVSMTLQEDPLEEDNEEDVVGLALLNQFQDVLIVMATFNGSDRFGSTGWVSSGDIRGMIDTVVGGETKTSFALADQSFPYLNGPLLAQCNKPPNGQVGVAYGPSGAGHYIGASGGTSPYTFSIVGGALPPGLSLTGSGADAGLISGTPTTAGLFLFTVQVQDDVGATVTITCSIAICPPSSGASNYGWTG